MRFFLLNIQLESAAFFNPSMVEDPDQTGLQEGEKRVIISFRATGEGHISSIAFRGGILDAKNNLELIPSGRLIDEAENVYNYIYNKESFTQKLREVYDINELFSEEYLVNLVMGKLSFEFDYNELNRAIDETRREIEINESQRKILKLIGWLGHSHYKISFSLDTSISDRVISPDFSS